MNDNMISFSHTRLGFKNKILLAFLGLILLTSLAPLQSISAAGVTIPASPVNLSDFATDASETPDIASSGDNVYVVWRDSDNIRFHKSTDAGTTFPGIPINIGNTTSSSSSGDPKVALDGANIYVVWREGSAIKFNDSNDSGATFAGAVLEVSSATSTSNRDPQVATSDTGEVHVVWRDRSSSTDSSILYSQSQDNGSSFNPIVVIDPDSDSGQPQPQIATFGTLVYVVWKDSTDILVAESTDNGLTFPTIVDIGDSGSSSLQAVPQIAFDDSGNLYVVWQETNDIKAAIKKSGESFGAAETIGDAGGETMIPPQIATSGTNAYVVWQDGFETGSDIKFKKSVNGGSFGAEINLSNSSSDFSTLPHIAASGSEVFVVWEDHTADSSGDILIKASSDSGSTFSAGAGDNVSSTDGETSTEPVISTSGIMAFVAWNDSDPGNDDILFKTVTREGADISFDSAQYKFSDTATITVTSLSDSGGGSISVDITSTTDGSGISVELAETETLGTFEGTITFTQNDSDDVLDVISVSAGDTITASFDGVNGVATIFSRTIQFDTGSGAITQFTLAAMAHVRVIDQNANIDETIQEKVEVTITSSADAEGILLILTETGVDTGEFGGNDGPTQSDLIFTNGTGLVPFSVDKHEESTSSIEIVQSDNLNADNSNTNSTEIDHLDANVTSTSDPIGIILDLEETGVDTAEFKAQLKLSFSASNQTTATLKIASGDFITIIAKAGSGSHLLVTPSAEQDGALEVTTPSDSNIQATYKTETITVTLLDELAPGGGGGGLVRPSLVVNALAGLPFNGGAGSPPQLSLADLIKLSYLEIPLEIEQMVLDHDSTVPYPPMELGLFEDFDYPMTINDWGFVLGGYENKIITQTLKTDSTNVIKFIIYGTTKIQHISFYTNLRDANSQIHQSDTQILYNDGQPLQIIDPNGFFSDVKVTINDIDENKKEVVFEIIFEKEMAKSDIIIRVWNPFLSSFDTIIREAIEVVPEIEVESPFSTIDGPEIQELKSQSIPIWIKNNAAWWSEQQISDSNFIAGIEYLIKNGIINVPGIEVGTSSVSPEIPDWIQNNAGWWSDSLITDEDFVEAMQWLVAKGVIQI